HTSELYSRSLLDALPISPSPDSVLGYHVYRAGTAAGLFTRLTSSLVGETSFTDTGVASGTYTYMVRAVKLESTTSGTYFNSSQGVFANVSGSAPPDTTSPTVAITTPADNATASGPSLTV